MVPEEGVELADRSGHPLMAVSNGARMAPVTLTELPPRDFKSFYFNNIDNITQQLTTRYNT